MTPERWQQIEQTFNHALSLPPTQRSSFLRRACGSDAELRREVEQMLESEKDASFLNRPITAKADAFIVEEGKDLFTGKQFSHYQILKRIGLGGMGEIYLAKDSRLSRNVALKILPIQYTQDQDRLQRFKIEAMAAARLNHQNIITVYEIEEADGIHFIATEFIEGTTLREWLNRGRMELDQALDIAIQMTRAIEAAHSAGIVHRDIKPENVMRRPDGLVKMLDFGLAKLTESQATVPPSSDLAEIKDQSTTLTQHGTLMGTPRYMSPEQVRAQNVDERTDIFSLGAVLYEMIAGQPPFQGETTDDLFAAILNKTPEPLSLLAPKAPKALERIVKKAIAKNPEDRHQKVGEMRAALQALKQKLEGKNQNSSKYIWMIASAVCVLSAAFFINNWLAPKTEWPIKGDQASKRLVEKSLRSGYGIALASISPNGKWVAYKINNEGKNIIRVSQLEGTAEWAVTDGNWKDGDPIWSSDGRKLVFASDREGKRGLWSVPFIEQDQFSSSLPKPELFREPELFGDFNILNGTLVACDKGDSIIYIEIKNNLYGLYQASGQMIPVTNFDPEKLKVSGFALSPLRDQIAYSSSDRQADAEHIFVKPLLGGSPKQITSGEGVNRYPSWFPDGKTIAYSSNRSGRFQIYLASLQRNDSLRLTFSESHHHFIAVSPDGKRMIYILQNETGRIFSCDVETAKEVEITSNSKVNRWPDVSRDGKFLSFQSLDVNGSTLNEPVIIQSAEGDRRPKMFETLGFDTKWAPGSRLLAFLHLSDEKIWELKLFDTHDGAERLLATDIVWRGFTRLPDNPLATNYNWSPDGTEIAYCSKGAGISNILKISTGQNASSPEPISQNTDINLRAIDPVWSPRDRRIAYVLEPNSSLLPNKVRSVWVTGKNAPVFQYRGWLRLLGWSSSGDEVYVTLSAQERPQSITESVSFLKISVDSGSNTPILSFRDVYLHSGKLSNDRKSLAFVSRESGQDNAYVVSTNGGTPRKITNNSDTDANFSGLNWDPDGKKLYYSKQTGRSEIWALQNLK